MTNPSILHIEPLDMDDARRASRSLAQQRQLIREEFEKAIRHAADKKRDYRKAKALAYVSANGSDAAARKADVEARVADAEFEMELAEGMVKVQAERLEEIDGRRASLHRLMEWSMKLDPLAIRQPDKFAPATGAAGVWR